MMNFSRRNMLKRSGALLGGSIVMGNTHIQARDKRETDPFSYCLNVSTIRGQELGVEQEIDIAGKAGYDGIEIWINGVEKYLDEGGKLKDLAQRAKGWGLNIENAIGFAKWIVDDNTVRKEALEQLKREMDMLAQLGCRRIAAPPAGATDKAGLDLDHAASRYHEILELGDKMGVVPQLEVWGFAKNLHKLSQVLYVASEAGHPSARILPDIYHLYKGGSDFDALSLISGKSIEIFHMNDYPSSPSREDMDDSHRVYPGLGVAPVSDVLRSLHRMGGSKVLSLELFNRSYWKEDPYTVALQGLQSMRSAVRQAMKV